VSAVANAVLYGVDGVAVRSVTPGHWFSAPERSPVVAPCAAVRDL